MIMRTNRSLNICGLLSALTLAAMVPAAALAQGGLEITPFLGLSIPVSDLAEGEGYTLKQGVGPALGVRVGLPPRGRLVWEGVFAFSQGDVEVTGNSFDASASGRRFMLTARARYLLADPGVARGFHLTGGLGVVHHAGDAYAALDGTTDPAGVVGGGYEFPAGTQGRIRIDLDVYVYSASFSVGSGSSTDGALQMDPLLSVGYVFRLRW
jgi:hypothetical protein